MTKEMRDLLKSLISVATGETPHIYSGLCPDELEGYKVRDKTCPACRIIADAERQIEGIEEGDNG